MFIILLTYVRPLDEVDRLLAEHRAFLEAHYASGTFLISGRREPRTGGVIIATGKSRTDIEAMLQEDPLSREGIATYEIIEFHPTMAAGPLSAYLTGQR